MKINWTEEKVNKLKKFLEDFFDGDFSDLDGMYDFLEEMNYEEYKSGLYFCQDIGEILFK